MMTAKSFSSHFLTTDVFFPVELLALLTPFGTTKDANPFTIGRFGIGFKYWNRFSALWWCGRKRTAVRLNACLAK